MDVDGWYELNPCEVVDEGVGDRQGGSRASAKDVAVDELGKLDEEDMNEVEGRLAGEGVETPRALASAASR